MWKKIIEVPNLVLQRGHLIKFSAGYPFEETVVMMVCGYPDGGNRLAAASLVTITGYCAGINAYVLFPSEVHNQLTCCWLTENWNQWVWPTSKLDEIYVRAELQSSEI